MQTAKYVLPLVILCRQLQTAKQLFAVCPDEKLTAKTLPDGKLVVSRSGLEKVAEGFGAYH